MNEDPNPFEERRLTDRIRQQTTDGQLGAIVTLQTLQAEAISKLEKKIEDVETKLHDRLELLEDNYRGGMGHQGVEERIREIERAMQQQSVLRGVADKNLDRNVELIKSRRTMWTTIIVSAIGLLATWGPKAFHFLNPPEPVIEKPRKALKKKRLNLMTYKKCDPATDPYYSEEACQDTQNTATTGQDQ